MKNLIIAALLLFSSTVMADTKIELNESIYKKDYKALLITNIATRCGYTPQLDGLEKLYKKYKGDGLLIVGIPSNDFAGQSPESNEKIKEFCRLKYGVTFPITKKIIVKSDGQNPFITSLLKNAKVNQINWNFEKFLFSKNGKFVQHFKSSVKPESDELINAINKTIK